MSQQEQKQVIEPLVTENKTHSWKDRSLLLMGKVIRTPSVLMGVLLLVYIYLFLFGNTRWAHGLVKFWFNPDWSTDDALQQVYPFFRAVNPEMFAGDFVTDMMTSYLAPLHYWMGFSITKLTGDPVMTAHWMMLIQVVSTMGFVFWAVKSVAGMTPALFSVIWLLHTRHIIQRMTAGLPRGWAAPVVAAFLCFALRNNHRAVLAVILVGCVLHPPSTLGIAAAYGLFLLWRFACKSTRSAYTRRFWSYVALSPVFALLTLSVVSMPKEIGSMVTYAQAARMPEFQSDGIKGRFPFVPLKPFVYEVKTFAFQAFYTPRLFKGFQAQNKIEPAMVMMMLAALALFCFVTRNKRALVPAALWFYGVAAFLVYVASRVFAFKLYVPDRHLQFPFAIWFIVLFSVAIWRLFTGYGEGEKTAELSEPRTVVVKKLSAWRPWVGFLGLACLSVFIAFGSGTGLYLDANFNYNRFRRGHVFEWISKNTPINAVIAGEPTYIDPVQLFGERSAYITTETAHPFFNGYWKEAKRRLEIELKAHYATSFEEIVSLLGPEKVNYLVFERARFSDKALSEATYFNPLHTLVKSLTARPVGEYAFSKLVGIDAEHFSKVVPYRDRMAVVVDIAELAAYLQDIRPQAKQPQPENHEKGLQVP